MACHCLRHGGSSGQFAHAGSGDAPGPGGRDRAIATQPQPTGTPGHQPRDRSALRLGTRLVNALTQHPQHLLHRLDVPD
ncbi:hypothetical protein RZS08_26790, partial [Arthrospira platensis SPKY1]|nr:hypothetical protein [Arthrospira platensis SPKY1]